MDLDDESYLHALRKLYGLLLINNGQQWFYNPQGILDEKARFLLKDLLNGAAKKVLKITPEVIATNLGLCNARSFTERQQTQDSPNQPFLLTNALHTSPNVVQRTEKDLDLLPTDLSNKQSMPETAQSVVSDKAQLSISQGAPKNSKKRCRVCQRSNSKQLKSVEEKKVSSEETRNISKDVSLQNKPFRHVAEQEKGQESNTKAIQAARSNEWPMQDRVWNFQPNLNRIGLPASLPNIMASQFVKSGALQKFSDEIEKKPQYTDLVSSDVSDVIKIIESCIFALQLGGKHVGSIGKPSEAQHELFEFSAGTVSGTGSVSPEMQRKAGFVTKGDQDWSGQFVMGRNDSQGQLVRQKILEPKESIRLHQVSRNVASPLGDMKSLNQTLMNSTPYPPCHAVLSNSMSQNVRIGNGILLEDDTFNQVGKPSEDSHVQNIEAIVEKIMSMRGNSYIPTQISSVQGLRIPLNWDQKSEKNILLANLPSEIDKEKWDGDGLVRKETLRKERRTKTSIPAVRSTNITKLDRRTLSADAGNKLIQTRTKVTSRKGLPHLTTKRQTLRDRKHKQDMVSPYEVKGGIKRKNNHKSQQRTSSSDQQESSARSQSSSSSWTTQEGNTSYDDSEEYSSTNHSPSQQFLDSNTSSESKEYYHPDRTRGHYSGSTSTHLPGGVRDHQTGASNTYNPSRKHGHHYGVTSTSDSEMYSMPSRTQSQVNSNSSSEGGGYLPSDYTSSLDHSGRRYHQVDYSSRRLSPTISYRSTYRRRPEKHMGRLRKLKDKLAIIFHHHHHHHLHHHYKDDDHSDQQSQKNHRMSLWKNAGRMFNRRSRDEVYGDQAAARHRKSVVHNLPEKKQGGNFHTLVDGFVRHVRHPKKTKQSKGGIGNPGKGQHVSKKGVNKVNWWRMLHHHRRMKMPKRPRVKLGLGSKKPQLQTLRTIKWK